MEKSYQANAFHPNFGSRTSAGRVVLSRDAVRFESEAGGFVLPMTGLRIRLGGNNAEQVFFEHPQHSGCSIYTTERQILDHESLSRNTALSEQLAALRRKRGLGKPIAVVSVVLVLFLILLAVIIGSKGPIVRYLAFRVPSAWESNLGNSILDQVKRQGKVISDPRLEAELANVTSRLLPVVANKNYDFRFHILDDTNVNAFALPGGNVVVLSGLLNAAKRPEEIAGVLAHEIAHVTERHGFRKIIDTAGLYLILQTLIGDATGLMAVISESSEFLLRQKYSRDFEQEADDIGWQHLVSANVDPRGMTDFFRTLMEREKAGLVIPGLLSTHPATDERIQRLEAKWEGMERKSGFIELAPARPSSR